VKNQRFRSGAAYGACGVMIICAALMIFLGDYRVAAMVAAQAGVAFCLSFNAAKTNARKPTQ
jgi:hypothetical protein